MRIKEIPLLDWGLILTTFTIPLSQFVSVKLLIVMTCISIFGRDWSLLKWLRNSWDVIGYLLILIIGLLYSTQVGVGFRTLETSFSLLGFSILIARTTRFSVKKFYFVIGAFVLGLSMACLICLIHALLKLGNGAPPTVFFSEDLTRVVNIHPTYFAYYLCFAITVGMYFLYYEAITIYKRSIVLILVLFFLFLMLTGERTTYVSMIFIFSFFMLKFLFEEKRSIVKKMTFCISVLFLVAMLVISHFNFNSASIPAEGYYWERLSLWKSSIDANPDFLLGVGTGDYKEVMNKYYVTHNLSQFAPDSFNAHNQFLQTDFSNGLIGLIALLLLIGRPLYLSVKYQNVLGILVFFSFIIYGMMEVFLGRYQGVVFFALLHQLFIHFYYSRQSSFSLKEI